MDIFVVGGLRGHFLSSEIF